MKLKKNVALIMVAAAMLAGGYAQADNPPPTPQGGAAEQINNPTGARAATTIKESLSKDGQRGGIFSKKDESRGYQKAWAQQGCTEEAWVELNNQYDKSINMSVDQSAVTDQKIMDVIQNPNQMDIKGFKMLGCDLNDALGGIWQTIDQARDIIQAIGSANPKDFFNKKLEDAAMALIKGAVKQAKTVVMEQGCKALNRMVDKAVNGEDNPFARGMSVFNKAMDAARDFERDVKQMNIDSNKMAEAMYEQGRNYLLDKTNQQQQGGN